MLRAACRMRCSFSTRAKAGQSPRHIPQNPNAGKETATSAFFNKQGGETRRCRSNN